MAENNKGRANSPALSVSAYPSQLCWCDRLKKWMTWEEYRASRTIEELVENYDEWRRERRARQTELNVERLAGAPSVEKKPARKRVGKATKPEPESDSYGTAGSDTFELRLVS